MTTTSGKRIGMIGLGLMGTALTERLLEHGYRDAGHYLVKVSRANRRSETATAHLSVLVMP